MLLDHRFQLNTRLKYFLATSHSLGTTHFILNWISWWIKSKTTYLEMREVFMFRRQERPFSDALTALRFIL